MALPESWIEELFTRLAIRYGVAFQRQYADMKVEAVKADWAKVLAGFSRRDIAYALEHLPADKPPTAMVMRDLCRRAPSPNLAALPAPEVRPEPEKAQALAATVSKAKPRASAAQECLDRIVGIVRLREGKWSMGQRHMVQAMHSAGLVDASAHGFTVKETA